MNQLIAKLQKLLPDTIFAAGSSFYWSPKNNTVFYKPSERKDIKTQWSLLHEAAHAKLGHAKYQSDFELLTLEAEAWETAKEIGKVVDVEIDEEHIQDCLDTYRDWLHQRSTCPACGIVSFQEGPQAYGCYNCNTKWHVSNSRFCRPYRLSQRYKNTLEAHVAPPTFK